MKIASLIYVFISALSVYSVWLYKYETEKPVAISTRPYMVGEVAFVYDRHHIRFNLITQNRMETYIKTECIVYTFYSDGHYTESKVE